MRKLDQLPPFSAIIFDLDGLVLDTEITYRHAWIKAANNMGYHLSEDFCRSMSGLHGEDVEKKLGDFCGLSFDFRQFYNLSGKYWHQQVKQQGIAVKKGFFNLLRVIQANNIPFCLATNSPQVNVLECLQYANLSDVFPLMVTRDDVKHGKPNPDIFLLAAELLQVNISQCWVLEDSKTGIQAAVSARANSIYIPSTFPFALSTVDLADYFFNDMDELAKLFSAQ